MKSRKVRSNRDPLENLSFWRDQQEEQEEPSDQVRHRETCHETNS